MNDLEKAMQALEALMKTGHLGEIDGFSTTDCTITIKLDQWCGKAPGHHIGARALLVFLPESKPAFDPAYNAAQMAKAAPAWECVKDPDAWLENVRGTETQFKLPSGREIKMPPARLRNNPKWIAAMERLLDGVDRNDPPSKLAILATDCTAASLYPEAQNPS